MPWTGGPLHNPFGSDGPDICHGIVWAVQFRVTRAQCLFGLTTSLKMLRDNDTRYVMTLFARLVPVQLSAWRQASKRH